MPSLAAIDLTERRDKVLRALQRGPVLVSGPVGSGRKLLADRLAAELDAVLVEPPPLADVDAALHALAQAALSPAETAIAFDDRQSPEARALHLAQRVVERKKTLLVRLPGSWTFAADDDSADRRRRRSDAFDVLRGFLHARRVVFFAASLDDADALGRSFDTDQTVTLRRGQTNPDTLDDAATWGSFIDAARAVRAHLGRVRALTPLQVRLAVGLVALGDAVTQVLDEVRPEHVASSLMPLVRRVRARLLRDAPALWRGLQALALARRPLPIELAVALAGVSEAQAPLVTQCLGYGDVTLRVLEPVREVLLDAGGGDQEPANARLAAHYQHLDGAESPLQLHGKPLEAWLEKAHHLAQVVSAEAQPGAQRWEDLDCPSRYLLWERARALSRTFRRYGDAAALYQRSLERFGDDDYAWHYLGFNLDKARSRPAEAEAAYAQAVAPTWADGRENPGTSNPWWNARHVTFLIRGGRFTDAEAAWGRALDAVDPDRARVGGSSWLARHFHRWVVQAWLDAGEVERARRVFDEVPRAVVERDGTLEGLAWRLRDAEEAVELTDSVYPASTRPEDRWVRPQLPVGSSAETWAPGRVLDASRKGVVVLLATPGAHGPLRALQKASLSPAQWREVGWGCRPEEACGFFELHVTRSGAQRLWPIAASAPPWFVGADDEGVPRS